MLTTEQKQRLGELVAIRERVCNSTTLVLDNLRQLIKLYEDQYEAPVSIHIDVWMMDSEYKIHMNVSEDPAAS